ncbi:MAG: hypothetical protein J1F05_01315 [Muribaculaceae bacterium]|nr:hypothetical protein [Muribaculaceae bacterium]
MRQSSKHIVIVIATTIVVLLVLSYVPWSSITENRIKDFGIFSDLFPKESNINVKSNIEIDPELTKFIAENQQEIDKLLNATTETSDSLVCAKGDSINSAPKNEPVINASIDVDSVQIENYTSDDEMFPHLKKALSQRENRLVRIAMIGDSFIEGDILCQDFRDTLQIRYGGCGVGYMAMHSDFPGFRKTVRQSDSGWTMHDVHNMKSNDTIRVLSGDYAKGSQGSRTTYKGSSFSTRTSSWQRSSFIFIAHNDGTINFTTSDGTVHSFNVTASYEPQYIKLDSATTSLNISSDIADLISLGAYLDGQNGVQLDCMSLRGASGVSHGKLNVDLCRRMAEFVDYDLIIVEFGINALTAEQTDYTPYMYAMIQAVTHIKKCYPEADILILGISDRGFKDGVEIKSMPTCDAMVKAQRELARRSGVYFWDTRAAMGGAGAIVDWRKRKLMNADYIHLNHKGGHEMAKLLSTSLFQALDE